MSPLEVRMTLCHFANEGDFLNVMILSMLIVFQIDQYQALVSKVTVQCSTPASLGITPNTVSFMYGANDTTGVPTVYASNQTSLLNSGPATRAVTWPLAVLALGSAAFMAL
jgi:hypothetical protein